MRYNEPEERYNEPEEQRSVAADREPVMDLRRLTDQIGKLHALLGEQSERISSLESNLASHENVLGKIGAYEAVEGRDR